MSGEIRPTNSSRVGCPCARCPQASRPQVGKKARDVNTISDRVNGGGMLGKTCPGALRDKVGYCDDGVDIGELAAQQVVIQLRQLVLVHVEDDLGLRHRSLEVGGELELLRKVQHIDRMSAQLTRDLHEVFAVIQR